MKQTIVHVTKYLCFIQGVTAVAKLVERSIQVRNVWVKTEKLVPVASSG